LRILKLLEEHHQHLAAVISSTNRPRSTAPAPTPAQKDGDPETNAPEPASDAKKSAQSSDRSTAASQQPNATPILRRPPRRDLTSSIASNLATARGRPNTQRRALPITPEVTTQHAGGNILNQVSQTERLAIREQSKTVRSSSPTPSAPAAHQSRPLNEGFQTFFTSFETLFSKLSAPLAFAGLPLTIEQATPQPESTAQSNDSKGSHSPPDQRRSRSRATADPDLTNLFSAPALRAIREDAGPAFGAHESFYVVPPSGGTLSYAGIVSGRGEPGENLDDDADEFVDARESIGPPSPLSVRGSGILSRSKKGQAAAALRSKLQPKSEGGKTMEELELENNALRQLLDTQSRRLQMWEASSQSQSLALAQSLRFSRPRDTATARGSIPSTELESERVKEREEVLTAERAQREEQQHRMEKMERENVKLLGVLGKYREKWESLKESAREKQRNKAAAATGDSKAGSSSK
jgi:hypothetical protein